MTDNLTFSSKASDRSGSIYLLVPVHIRDYGDKIKHDDIVDVVITAVHKTNNGGVPIEEEQNTDP